MTSVLIGENRPREDTWGERHVMKETETGRMYLQAKEHQVLPATTEARKRQGRILP